MIKNKVVKNSMWMIASRIAQSILAFFISTLTARYLGPSNFGLISYAASLVAFAVPIMYLGIEKIFIQEIVKNPEHEGEIAGTAMLTTLISSVFCVIGVISFVHIAHTGERDTILVTALYSILLIFQSLDIVQHWFQAKLLSKYIAIILFFASILASAYKVFLLVTGKSVYWFAIYHTILYFLIAVGLLVMYKKVGKQRLTFSAATAKRLLSRGKHFIPSTLLVVLTAQVSKIMLRNMMGNAALGYFSIAVVCAGITSFVFSAIIVSAQPVIFKNKEDDEQLFKKNLSALYAIIIYLALLQSIVIFGFSNDIVSILFGSDFLPAIPVVRIFIWQAVFSFLGAVRNIWILSENKQKYLWFINLCGVAVSVLLNFLLIPIFGVEGAAISSLLTQIFTNVIMSYILKPMRPVNQFMMQGLHPKVF